MNKKITNIDILEIGNSCNNAASCNQCFLGKKAIVKGSIDEQKKLYSELKQKNSESSFFIYPAEITTSQSLIDLLAETGQKAMTNGLAVTEIFLDSLLKKGIDKISFSIYSDADEQAVFYSTSSRQYESIVSSIKLAAKKGFDVSAFSIVTPDNLEKLPELMEVSADIGIKKLELMRLTPLGKAKTMPDKYYMQEEDLEKLLILVNSLKQETSPYISLSVSCFGPNFYGNTVNNFFNSQNESWVKTKTLCPAINGEYVGVLANSKKITWCFKMSDEPEAVIGYVDNGLIQLENQPDFSANTLTEKLEGICSKDSCEYQSKCLGGCRAKAVSFAMKSNPDLSLANALYSPMPFCITDFLKKRPEIRKEIGYR